MAVGIDNLVVNIPNTYMECEELANYRDIPPEKILEGIGCKEFSVPYDNTIYNLAVESILELGLTGAKRYYFGCESHPDLSKPVGAEIMSKLNINQVEIRDLRFACVSGVQALQDAYEYTSLYGKPSVVTTTDRSIYQTGGSEEFTQGCGSVAMLITENPSILELNLENSSSYVQDVDDFKVPYNSYPTPIVNGRLSIITYLHTMKKAYESWVEKSDFPDTPLDYFDFFTFHSPFPKMTKKSFSMLYRKEKTDIEHLSVEEFLGDPDKFEEDKTSRKTVMGLDDFKKMYSEKVSPSMKYMPRIGNGYTSSVFMALASVLEEAERGDKVGVGGYGSGSGAVVFDTEVTTSDYSSGIKSELENRRKLSIEEYEDWREEIIG